MATKHEIRNSTAEFLTFVAAGKEEGIQVLYKNETIWATPKAMATLFDCSTDNISLHLKNIFKTGKLIEDSVTEKSLVTAADGKNYITKIYNLDGIISVGYRVNSIRAAQFRQWCTYGLRQFALRGSVTDKKRMENGSFIGKVSQEFAKQYAETEFEKYRVIQDKLFSSDFDKFNRGEDELPQLPMDDQ